MRIYRSLSQKKRKTKTMAKIRKCRHNEVNAKLHNRLKQKKEDWRKNNTMREKCRFLNTKVDELRNQYLICAENNLVLKERYHMLYTRFLQEDQRKTTEEPSELVRNELLRVKFFWVDVLKGYKH